MRRLFYTCLPLKDKDKDKCLLNLNMKYLQRDITFKIKIQATRLLKRQQIGQNKKSYARIIGTGSVARLMARAKRRRADRNQFMENLN